MPLNLVKNKEIPVPMAVKLMRFGFSVGGRLSPSVAGKLAYKLWFTPPRFNIPTREKTILASAQLNTHQINDNEIVTFSWGQDKTEQPLVLLVHGWSGRGTQLASFVQPLLDAGYRVLSFDAPAHGQSSGKQTNLYEIADVIVKLQKQYGAIDATITHSFGGPCIAVAMQRGFETNRIVSISPPSTTIGLIEKFNNALYVPKQAAVRMIALIEDKYSKEIWDSISMVNTIVGCAVPGLVIHDENDVDIPWQEGESIALSWNNAPFIKTSGLGHRRILRDPHVIESAVTFITEKKT